MRLRHWAAALLLASGCLRGAETGHGTVVAADGSGEFRTIQEAVDAAPQLSAPPRWVIRVKPGYYDAPVYIPRGKRFITLSGADPLRTTLGYGRMATDVDAAERPIGVFKTASVEIDADDFVVENLTITNSAGPGAPAIALSISGDRDIVRNCRITGWQNTLFVDRGRQYFEGSFIAGDVDFIFGGATAFFSHCDLHCWRDGCITAASTPADEPFGFVFDHCRITGETPAVRTYLGRPAADSARVAFLANTMAAVMRPERWDGSADVAWMTTARLGEFGSIGPGSARARGVPWAHPLSATDAAALTAERVLGSSDHWDPQKVDGGAGIAGRALGPGTPFDVPGFTIEGVLRLARASFPHQAVALPPATVPPGVVDWLDVQYAESGGHRLALDIYRPAKPGRCPAVVIIHGGGWVGGDRTMERPLAIALAARGYVAVPVSYRLGIDGRFPGAVYDLKGAVRWLRSHAGAYNIDPERIGAIGGSAGGTLAALLGASNGVLALEGHVGPAGISSEVQAVVAMDGAANMVDPRLIAASEANHSRFYVFMHGGYGDSPGTWRAMSPINYVSRRSAPILFINSTSAQPILPGRTEMAACLRALRIPAEIETVPGTPHPFWLVQPWFDGTVARIDAFFTAHLRKP